MRSHRLSNFIVSSALKELLSQHSLSDINNSRIGIPSQSYDPYKIPPSFSNAKKHQLATRVHDKEIGRNVDLCECCGLPWTNDKISWNFNDSDIEHLGVSFPIFFSFLRSCMILLLVMGLFNYAVIIWNLEEFSDSGYTIIQKLTAIPFMLEYTTNKNTVIGTSLMNLGLALVFFVYFQCIRNNLGNFITKCDKELITPGDYTIVITGLHGIKYTKDEICDFLCKHLQGKSDNLIKKIVFAINLDYINSLIQKYNNLCKQKRKFEYYVENKGHDTEIDKKINELDEECSTLQENILNLMNEYKNYDIDQGSGTIFVSFNSVQNTKIIKKKFKRTSIMKIFIKLCNHFGLGKFYQHHFFKGKYLIIKRAPEPTDIIWDNMNMAGSRLWIRRKKLLLFTTLLIALGFAIIFGINYYKYMNDSDINSDVEEQNQTPNKEKALIVSFICSFIIILINTILSIIINRITKIEYPKTHTYLANSKAEKIIMTKFFNTAFVTFFTQAYLFTKSQDSDSTTSSFEVLNQLVTSMFFVFIMSSITVPLLKILDPSFLFKSFQRRKLERMGKSCTLTQAEVNSIFENQPCDLSAQYANVINIVYVCAFYGCYIPVGIPISLIGIILIYFTDKYNLVNRQSIPHELGKELPHNMIEYLEWFAFFYVSGIIFYGLVIHTLYGDNGVLNIGIIGGIICFILVLLWTNSLYKKLFKSNEEEAKKIEEQGEYDDVYLQFETDYDRTNPITKKEAEEKFLRRRLTLEQDENSKMDIMNCIKNLESMMDKDIICYFQHKPRFEFHYQIKTEQIDTCIINPDIL